MAKPLESLLTDATYEQLTDVITAIYGMHADVDARIESLLLQSQPDELAKQLKKRIQSLMCGRRFIDYREMPAFARGMDEIMEDIEPLLAIAPKQAFEVMDQFMASHKSVYERGDDSCGHLGDVYRQGVALWLTAASLWRAQGSCRKDWVAELRARHESDNDYAVWDTLITGCHELLTTAELTQLGAEWEQRLQQLVADLPDEQADNYFRFRWEVTKAHVGVAAVATALKDVVMYERALLLCSPEPNELQRQDVVRFCLSVGDGAAALKWLQPEGWHRYKSERLTLMDKALQQLGRMDELRALRQQCYDQSPNYHSLQVLLEVLPEAERVTVEQQAVEKVCGGNNTATVIDSLLALAQLDVAAEQLLARAGDLSSVGYPSLLDWVERFKADYPLATVLCYRNLLDDVLASGRSKAYRHAASYYRNLSRLDARGVDYRTFSTHLAYQQRLRERHGRKRSFWQQVD